MPAQTASYTFNVDGIYNYVCIVHSGMTGVVRVGNAGAPPPLPLSAQRFGNDDASVFPAETITLDTAKPSLKSVSARRSARGALRVRFRVSEESVVQVRLLRAGKTVKTASSAGTGTRGVTISSLKAGRYNIEVVATDLAGNRSSLKRMHLTVR
jgi:hypothetical protein